MSRITVFALFIFSICLNCFAQETNGWRGINRDGHYASTGLLKAWPAEGPEQLWSVTDLGKGHSSPVISGNRIFVTGMDDEEKNETLTAYTIDGQKIYQVKYGRAWDKSYPDTRTTPTVADDKVYVISGKGDITCLNAADGKIIWSVNGEDKFVPKTNVWGISESPLVFGNKVIFTPGGEQTTMVALDAETGETIWKTSSLNDPCSHVSPLLITHNGIQQIIGFSENYAYGVSPVDGEMMWNFKDWDFIAKRGMDGICINTPLFRDGKLFVSNAYEMRSHMLELNENATGVKLLWRNDDMSVHTGGMVLLNDVIYGSNWFNNNNGDWVTVDWNTGRTRYKTTWEGRSKGSIITADGLIICYEERRGTVALLKPDPDKFEIISEFRVNKGNGAHWAHPVIDNGILYIRHGNALLAYKIK